MKIWLAAAGAIVLTAVAAIFGFHGADDVERPGPGRLTAKDVAPAQGIAPASEATNATAPANPNTTVIGDPADYARLARTERRDDAWAEPREGAIAKGLRGLSFAGPDMPLQVRCATSVCAITGTVSASSPEAAKLMWQELQQFTEGDALTPAGLVSGAALFGDADNPYAFTLYYRRDDAMAAAR